MNVLIDFCVYCERSADELALLNNTTIEEALSYVRVNGSQIKLCSRCASSVSQSEPLFDTDEPIEFPPGVEIVEHECGELKYRQQESTLFLTMYNGGDGYNWAKCPFCDVTVKSRLVD